MLGLMLSIVIESGSAPIRIENCALGNHPTLMECDLSNIGSTAIARIRFDAEATDQHRSVPWEKASGSPNYGMGIRGGIEPGETLRHRLMIPSIPGRASDETLILKLLDLQALDVNGEPIAP